MVITDMERINALDLFSGIGGNTLALREWVRTIAYCEADRHAQAVLLSRMSAGDIEPAPICTDIKELDGHELRGLVDIIIAGFPCQDISVAGKGKGLDGERSGLFFEIVRLAEEIEPAFLFLENVPAIRTRGLDTVIEELTEHGYDCRWTTLSAAEIGAPHKRDRWFLLANSRRGRRYESFARKMEQSWRAEAQCSGNAADSKRIELWNEQQWQSGRQPNGVCDQGQAKSRDDGEEKSLADAVCNGSHGTEVRSGDEAQHGKEPTWSLDGAESERRPQGLWSEQSTRSDADLANTHNTRLEVIEQSEKTEQPTTLGDDRRNLIAYVGGTFDGIPETLDRTQRDRPALGHPWKEGWEEGTSRTVSGLIHRVDRIKRLGNAVVPLQAKTAFKYLMGVG